MLELASMVPVNLNETWRSKTRLGYILCLLSSTCPNQRQEQGSCRVDRATWRCSELWESSFALFYCLCNISLSEFSHSAKPNPFGEALRLPQDRCVTHGTHI